MRKKEWKNILSLVADFSKENRSMTICLFLISIIDGIKPFVAVVLTGILVDAVYRGEPFEKMLQYAVMGIAFSALCSFLSAFGIEVFNRKMEYIYEAQNRPLNYKSMKMDYEYLEEPSVHKMRRNIVNSGKSFGLIGGVYSSLNKFLVNIVSIITALVVSFPMFIGSGSKEYGFIGSWYLSVLMLVLIGVIIWMDYRYSLSLNKEKKRIRDEDSAIKNKQIYYLNLLSETERQKDIRIFGRQQLVQEEMERLHCEEQIFSRKFARVLKKHVYMAQLVSIVSGLAVYLLTGLRAYMGIISIGNVVTYAAAILRLTTSMSEMMNQVGYLQAYALYAEDYSSFLALGKRKYDGTIPMEKRQDNKFSVEFDHVSFQYPGSDEYVLRDLNLSFVIGQKMAIVGKNGSGKTTFIKLLCRLYDVTEGSIKVNGIDIRNYNYQEYCDLFSVVFQDFWMPAFTLGENVATGADVDEARAADALRRAGLGDRLASLPDGLATYVGKEYEEDGVNFSGGEKQKLAIARAVYKDAPLVIMDEPTAALDPVSECEVFAGFNKMVGDKTAIYISHRLASCRFCEDILVFDKGCVVQRGNHGELVNQEGLYRELWNAQAQYYA